MAERRRHFGGQPRVRRPANNVAGGRAALRGQKRGSAPIWVQPPRARCIHLGPFKLVADLGICAPFGEGVLGRASAAAAAAAAAAGRRPRPALNSNTCPPPQLRLFPPAAGHSGVPFQPGWPSGGSGGGQRASLGIRMRMRIIIINILRLTSHLLAAH